MKNGKALRRHRFDPVIVKRIRELYGLDNYHGITALLSDYVVIAASIYACVALGWIAYPFAVLVIGSRQRALATMTHEASHGTLAKNRRFNNIMGSYMSGYLIGMLFDAYKQSHVQSHHAQFGSEENDADYRYMIDMGVYDECSQGRYNWNILLKPLFLLNVPKYLGFLIRDRLLAINSEEGAREGIRLLIFWAVLLIIIIQSGFFVEFLLYWVVPFLTAFQVLGWYIELSEHAPMMETKLDIHMSRNRNSHWFERALTGLHGESYHLAHHLWARVPFWKLPELNAILREDDVYRTHDDRCGGILLSNNGAPAVISLLCRLQIDRKAMLPDVNPEHA
ncbi:MAG: fatty acid desaturase family protein [Alphaproteobacteria bacterium]|nr:fatty acid desaturase family protein [Alphaproteobacteria bacterium]